MKIFLAQIYCLFLFGFESEKIRKSVFDIVYKCFWCCYISVLMLLYKCKINGSKLSFLWYLFLTKKRVQKGVYRNEGLFLLWDRIKVHQTNRFYTTEVQKLKLSRKLIHVKYPNFTPSAKIYSREMYLVPKPPSIST